ncbi:helix-hairpin-helix domain-containing protein [Polaribacter sp. Asnod1-A03]|uniref:helix-hairpin-helix domain-containing protein n=1 Tax=Polaribacter sp. Asnod1-A03 TaxID=3160581 RepID=UPI00386FE0F8
MNFLKSHFWYTKNQRNGIFFLVILIIILQLLILFSDSFFDREVSIDTTEVFLFQKEIDRLKKIELENRKPKIYPFNPNYITDYKGEQLGMSLGEIDRLLAYRKTGEFINSVVEFQKVTKVSDSLLNKISPYFKFPKWISESKQQNVSFPSKGTNKTYLKKAVSTNDLNKATAEDFKTINGIGDAFSERIIKYRSKLQGFSIANQIFEVWGLEKEIGDKVLSVFKIKDKPIIKKLNVNTVTFKELLKNPYIDYELCKKIFDYRDEVAELQNISELKNIKDFPLDKYDRIVLYLVAQ